MSIGELINVYRDEELVVNPEFQRLFRWTPYQKAHFIESLLIGIPIPSIFVFEQPEGAWELIDGLQRVSTILEFVGILRNPDGGVILPSVMQSTRTLPSLKGTSWSGAPKGSAALSPAQQIAIKRARIGVQILKKTSDVKAKYDLFQRLNSHGSQASDQELRNCSLVMLNSELYKAMKKASEETRFASLMQSSETAQSSQSMMDYITRFFVFLFVDYDKRWEIEDYLNNGIIELATDEDDTDSILSIFEETVDLIAATKEPNILKRFKDGKFSGRVGQAGFEAIFLGVAQNRKLLAKHANSSSFILSRAKELWSRPEVADFTKGGVSGTTRIQKTIPFGRVWFKP